ncbi:MAG TPA: acyltransferase [Edaphobacter sp.]
MNAVMEESVVLAAPTAGNTRSNTVDIMKGIAISLMTFGHTSQGMLNRGWWGGPGYLFSYDFIYSFHMPVFFFTAGLFVIGSLTRRGVRKFTLEKVKTLLYPYLLWAVLYAVLEPFITRYKNSHHPFELKAFMVSLLVGEQGWFLYTLFGCLMLAILMRRWPAWLRVMLGVGVGILTPQAMPVIGNVAREFCFMAVGMWVGTQIYSFSQWSKIKSALAFVAVTLFQIAMIVRFGEANRWSYVLLGLTGTAGVFLLAQLIEQTKVGDLFAWLGQASLGIFLIAAFVQGAAREFLFRVLHIQEFWLQLLVPTVASTVIPAFIWYQQDRLRLGWLFSWPVRKNSASTIHAKSGV